MVIDDELAQRCARLSFQIPEVTNEARQAAADLVAAIEAYGLPQELWQLITSVNPVVLLTVGREARFIEGPMWVDTTLHLSTIRERQLVVDIDTGYVLFLTPRRDYLLHKSFEAFTRCTTAYFEGLNTSDDLRADIEMADPFALSDAVGIWEAAIDLWETHKD